MKSFKQLRKDKGVTLIQLQERTGVFNGMLSDLENGKHSPTVQMRKLIEDTLGEPINWIDAPIKVVPLKRSKTWLDCEKHFRTLLKEVATLPKDQKEAFCITASYHLHRLWKNDIN
jgi:transcriptional regulator with XRE-family HTH domain